MVIVDTNIIIDHLRKPRSRSWLEKIQQSFSVSEISISVISIQELCQGQSTAKAKAETTLLATIAPLQIAEYNYQIAKSAGKIIRDSKEPIVFADAAIAASVIKNEAQLATLNGKHFENIPNLKLLKLDEL